MWIPKSLILLMFFPKFKNDRIKVWRTGIRVVISIISNINVTIFKKKVADVNVKGSGPNIEP